MKMLHRFATLAAIASVAAFQAQAEVETVTSSATTFAFYGNPEKAYSLASTTELVAWPVTWRAGETVVATSMDGTATTLSGGADATSASLPSQGGVWTVTLKFADNTTRTAHIDIQASGFMIIVK